MHFDFVFKLRVYIVTKIIITLLAGWKDSTAKLTIQLMSATQHFRERVKPRNHISLDRYILSFPNSYSQCKNCMADNSGKQINKLFANLVSKTSGFTYFSKVHGFHRFLFLVVSRMEAYRGLHQILFCFNLLAVPLFYCIVNKANIFNFILWNLYN